MFTLLGKNGDNCIIIKPIDFCGYGHEGYVYKCRLTIVADSLGVNYDELFIARGEIISFDKSLDIVGNKLITMGVFANEDLNFTVTSTKYGQTIVEGVFNQNNGKNYM
ncbi:MAG TPA: hypothetical protein PLM10_07625, partial [Saccharofermentans sp.]|nr:hypothetical protein [Saccharofermentans sp.]